MIFWALRIWSVDIEKSDWEPWMPVGCIWSNVGRCAADATDAAAYASRPVSVTAIGTTMPIRTLRAPAAQIARTLGEAALMAFIRGLKASPTTLSLALTASMIVFTVGPTAHLGVEVNQ